MASSKQSGKSVPQAGMEGDRLKTQRAAGGKQEHAVPGEPNKPRGSRQTGMAPAGGKGASSKGTSGKRGK